MQIKASAKNQQSAKYLSLGFQLMYQERIHDAITMFDKAIELAEDCALLAYQGRALCNSLLFDEMPQESLKDHMSKIALDLIRGASLARDTVEHLSRQTGTQ